MEHFESAALNKSDESGFSTRRVFVVVVVAKGRLRLLSENTRAGARTLCKTERERERDDSSCTPTTSSRIDPKFPQ